MKPTKYTPVTHQFSLFGYLKPTKKIKVPISAERIKAAKELYDKGDHRGLVTELRELRYGLENYLSRISNGIPKRT